MHQYVTQRPPSAAEDSLLRAARHARRATVAGELLHHVLRRARASALVHVDRPAARRVRTSDKRWQYRAAGVAARGAMPLSVYVRKRPEADLRADSPTGTK